MVEADGSPDPQQILNEEYEQVREEFDIVSLAIGTLLCIFVLWMSGVIGGDKP